MIAVLGAFDGIHKGHAHLFERAKETAVSRGLEWGGVTFDSSPALYMGTIENVLFTPRERELIRLFLGIPKLVILKFDDELSRFSPERFWEYLHERITVDGIVVGRDFRFGHRRAGDALLLERYCREAGVFFLSVDLLMYMGVKISSSAIKTGLEAGQCEQAAVELGYPYFMMAKVTHGLERGRKLGFPTANLDVPGVKLMPCEGVYAVAVLVKGTWKAGALSIGKNPTFGDVPDVRAEVFVLDHDGDLYDDDLLVFFLSRIRPQARFECAEQLALRISADVDRSMMAFKRSLDASPDCYSGFKAGHEKITARPGE
jgi:riboflavin kinase/FMN adenylyltransferase